MFLKSGGVVCLKWQFCLLCFTAFLHCSSLPLHFLRVVIQLCVHLEKSGDDRMEAYEAAKHRKHEKQLKLGRNFFLFVFKERMLRCSHLSPIPSSYPFHWSISWKELWMCWVALSWVKLGGMHIISLLFVWCLFSLQLTGILTDVYYLNSLWAFSLLSVESSCQTDAEI